MTSVEVDCGVYARIYRCIDKIPAGKVATYGQIAKLVSASGARQVGYALSATPNNIDIPWHRVINAKGEISPRSGGSAKVGTQSRKNPAGDSEQQQRLLAEGVMPNKHGRIDLSNYQWAPTFEQLLDDLDERLDDEAWLDQPGFG